MDKKTIETIRDKHQAIADRNFENYQMSGEPRYLRTHDRESDLVDICNLALDAADTAMRCGNLKSDLCDFAYTAENIVHSDGDETDKQEQAMQLVERIYKYGIVFGLIRDVWGEAEK